MKPEIIDRGRGPEIAGTRITVYTIYEYAQGGFSTQEMTECMRVTAEEVQAALDYIAAHREEVEAGYEKIMERIRQGNPAWVEALMAKTPEELRQRILARRAAASTHAHPGGQ